MEDKLQRVESLLLSLTSPRTFPTSPSRVSSTSTASMPEHGQPNGWKFAFRPFNSSESSDNGRQKNVFVEKMASERFWKCDMTVIKSDVNDKSVE